MILILIIEYICKWCIINLWSGFLLCHFKRFKNIYLCIYCHN